MVFVWAVRPHRCTCGGRYSTNVGNGRVTGEANLHKGSILRSKLVHGKAGAGG